MAQPEPFLNHINAGQPALTRNMFTVNPNLIILYWVCVGFTGYVVIHVGGADLCCANIYDNFGSIRIRPIY